MSNIEIWKDIVGYEGLYQVSNLGRVKSLARTKINHSKQQIVPERIMKPILNTNGYFRVMLYGNGKSKLFYIHRLVAEVFIPNPENKPSIDHIDTDITNNKSSNLRWCTQKENMNNDKTKEKLKGNQNGKRSKVLCITTGKVFNSIKEASEYYNIHSTNISACCNGRQKTAGKLSNGTRLEWKHTIE